MSISWYWTTVSSGIGSWGPDVFTLAYFPSSCLATSGGVATSTPLSCLKIETFTLGGGLTSPSGYLPFFSLVLPQSSDISGDWLVSLLLLLLLLLQLSWFCLTSLCFCRNRYYASDPYIRGKITFSNITNSTTTTTAPATRRMMTGGTSTPAIAAAFDERFPSVE